MVSLDDGKKDREDTGCEIPNGDGGRDGKIIDAFAVGEGRGVGMIGTRMELLERGWEKQAMAAKKGGEKIVD